jgi:hypothetical protein
MSGNFPTINLSSEFYLGCKKKRDNGEELCNVCPFRSEIELQESMANSSSIEDINIEKQE